MVVSCPEERSGKPDLGLALINFHVPIIDHSSDSHVTSLHWCIFCVYMYKLHNNYCADQSDFQLHTQPNS